MQVEDLKLLNVPENNVESAYIYIYMLIYRHNSWLLELFFVYMFLFEILELKL